MNLTITRGQRSQLLFLSAASYIAWFAGVGARIDARDVAQTHVAAITIAPPSAVPNVSRAIERDPFAGSPDVDAAAHDAPQHATTAGGEPEDVVPDITDETVADAAPVTQIHAAAPRTLVVRATIVSRRSVAYVDDGSAMEIVRVGDTLGGRRIEKIDLDGIVFGDGTRLDLRTDYEATPKPKQSLAKGLTISLERLRELLAKPTTRAATPVPSTSAIAAPASTPIAAITPEPIRTIDSAGIVPGTNPTPDLRDATAYPYPYPYPATPHR